MIIWIATQEEDGVFVDVLGVFSSVEKGKSHVEKYNKQHKYSALGMWVYNSSDQCWTIDAIGIESTYFLDSYELDKESLE